MMMEPAAPGTEEVPLTFPTVSKQESEHERLLSIKAFLTNGQYGNVFERTYNSGAEHWYCNMCQCPIMGRVYHHEIGKRHTSNMSNCQDFGRGVVNQQQAAMVASSTIQQEPVVHVAPGEPVPPGFEGEVEKVCEIQERLDNYTVGPLVGLEYLFELQEYDRDKEPTYLCMLCDKKGDPRTVIAHLASYNHITQFLQKHFITVYRALSPYATKMYKRNWQNAVQKIAEAIENRYGRLKPHPVEMETFEQKRLFYLEKVVKGQHFCEKIGVTFEELVDKNELTKSYEDTMTINKPPEDRRNYRNKLTPTVTKKRSPSPPIVAKPTKKTKATSSVVERRRSLSSVSSISSSDLSDFEPEKQTSGGGGSRRSSSRKRSVSPRRSTGSRYRRSPSPRNRRSRERDSRIRDRESRLPPWQRSDYRRPRSDFVIDNRPKNKVKSDKWDEYKKLATAIENDMTKQLKQHEKNPEKHPQYNDEWKQFWNRRYKELQTEGKDPSKHDFKPEWILFWNKRMSELHNNEVKLKKDALRRRLGLPEEPAPICFKITGKKRPKPIATASPDIDSDVIVIDDKEEEEEEEDDDDNNRRSHSPWEDSEPSSSRRRTRSRSRSLRRERSRERTKDRDLRGRSDKDYYDRGASWDRDIKYYDSYRRDRDLLDAYKPPRVMRDVTRQPVLSPPSYPTASPVEPDVEDNGDINVVSVLRLLTALEEKLGSLGPKVIDLLAQALAMEKNEANSSETILDNEINCVLFETVKEKLKGQLLAGLVEYSQEKAYKNAIKKIASLIHFAGERKKEREAQLPSKKMDPVKVPGVGAVDKAAIAKQIATALIMQGKTDVTQAELEQLINAVVGMAEASKNSNKPITTATFLQQLEQKQKPPQTIENNKPMTNALQALQSENTNSMEGLSDSDLQTLLQNFKDLSTTEQHDLITYLKKLESKEPERVERLRKFVTLGGQDGERMLERKESGRLSPFSNRLSEGNPMVEQQQQQQQQEKIVEYEDFEVIEEKKIENEKPLEKVHIDSDEEEEYSFEDVFKAAKKNVKENEAEKERLKEETKKTKDVDLKDAKAIIASLMSSVTVNKTNVTTSAMPVNMDNLTNIVGNLKNLMEPARAIQTVTPTPVPVPQQQQQQIQNLPFVQYPIRNQPSYSSNNYGYQQNVQYPIATSSGNNRMPPYVPRAPNPPYNPRPGNYGNRW